MTNLSSLTDQQLNELCCKALGWKQVDPFTWQDEKGVKWTANVLKSIWTPAWFCSSLDLIQQYLVPVLRSQPASVQQRYYQHAQRVYWQSGEADGMLDQFMLMSIPARVRVLAFLRAMEVQRES